jgi:hypothetical protein
MTGSQGVRLGWYRSKQTDRSRELSALLLRHGNVHNPTKMVQRKALSNGTLCDKGGRGGFGLGVNSSLNLQNGYCMDMFRRRLCFGDAKESNYAKRTTWRTLMTVPTPLCFGLSSECASCDASDLARLWLGAKLGIRLDIKTLLKEQDPQ